ncbi:hypothetical protein [Halomonas koreensis]|uniref:Uncharacterized protein n=1 Tax=Halomonas koreensis TaxID=245385 RepID=A0ABU1G4P6_9GAMM|nr:hypothetical protein [Halomonas koreensis]MDR5867926.1 hypothetical protein [Halomonas koreensis]
MTQSAYIPLGGGLDLVTPPRQLQPGAALSCINYECPVTGGYRRIDGYAQLGPVVPGQGPVLGVATFDDRHYAVREDAGGGTATLYRLSLDETTWEVMGAGGELAAGRHEFDEGNAYATESGKALYGVGGGQPFEIKADGTLTVLANAPSGATMIALHHNHLFLGFAAGSLQFSNIGDPAGWDASTGGAGEIGVGQQLNGILKGVGGVLHVLCRDSVQTLRGTSAADFLLEITVPGAGARAHSGQSLMMPYFVGERGITTLEATQRYGDFSPLQAGRNVEPLFAAAGLADRVVASSVSRDKAQYRVFFDNGTGLYMSSSGITQVQLPDQVAVTHAGELASGEEVLLFGDDQGSVFRLDQGQTFNGTPIRAFLTLAYTDLKSPSTRKRFRRAFFDVRAGSDARIWIQPDFDYGDNQTGRPRRSPIDFMLGGGLWGVDNWGEFNWSVPTLGQEPLDVSGTGTSINFAIFSESDSPSHELLGYDLQFDVRRNRRG